MFEKIQNPLSLAGRALIALMFIPAGLSKIAGFAGTAGYIASKGLPLPELGVVIAIAVELLGGLALLAGFGTRLVAAALVVFTLVASVIFHNYWGAPADQVMTQTLMFYKNIAIIGGLLTLAAHGAGAWSVDAKRGA